MKPKTKTCECCGSHVKDKHFSDFCAACIPVMGNRVKEAKKLKDLWADAPDVSNTFTGGKMTSAVYNGKGVSVSYEGVDPSVTTAEPSIDSALMDDVAKAVEQAHKENDDTMKELMGELANLQNQREKDVASISKLKSCVVVLIRMLDKAQLIPPESALSEFEWEKLDEDGRFKQWLKDLGLEG